MYWRQWLQTLLALVILLCVLEILLPPGELGKFSKLVLGLAIMLAVLQPLAILLNTEVLVLDYAWDQTLWREPDVEGLAERVRLAATTPFLKDREEQVAKEIEDLLLRQLDLVRVRVGFETARDLVVQITIDPYSPVQAQTIRDLAGSILNLPRERIVVKRQGE